MKKQRLIVVCMVLSFAVSFMSFLDLVPPAQAVFEPEDIVWEDGFEDGDESFPSWDSYYTDAQCYPSSTDISTAVVRGANKSVKFTLLPDGSEWARRLGLFIHHQIPQVTYEAGFYWSYWMYIPSNVADFIDTSEGNWLTIGGLKWYFLNFKWSFGARWRLYYSSTYSKIRAGIHIGGHINSGYESPQDGYTFNEPSEVNWYYNVTYGAWNHFQIYLKAKTDATGSWQAWVNDNLLGTISNAITHPDGLLSPVPPASFYSQSNKQPHPQLMYYTSENQNNGVLYADDCVIATEKVTEAYKVDYPTITDFTPFYNGFEEGTFSKWNGTNEGGGGIAPSIITNPVYNGSYAANITTDGSDDSWSRVKKQFQAVNEVYARTWVRFQDLPDTNNTRLMVINLQKDGSTYIASAGVYNMSGNYYWAIHIGADPANPPSNYTQATINVDTWYSLDLYFNATTNGNATLWVNEILKCEVVGDFSSHSPIAEVLPYLYVKGTQASSKTVIHDNFGVDDHFIGTGNPIMFKTNMAFLTLEDEPYGVIPNVLINGSYPTDENGLYIWYNLIFNHIYTFVVEKPSGYYPAWVLNVDGSSLWNGTHYVISHNVTEAQEGYLQIFFFSTSQPYVNSTSAKLAASFFSANVMSLVVDDTGNKNIDVYSSTRPTYLLGKSYASSDYSSNLLNITYTYSGSKTWVISWEDFNGVKLYSTQQEFDSAPTYTNNELSFTINTTGSKTTEVYSATRPTYITGKSYSQFDYASNIFTITYAYSGAKTFMLSWRNLEGIQIRETNGEITGQPTFVSTQLIFSISKTGGTSRNLVYVGTKGEPTSVTGASSWSYDSSTKILTLSVAHSSAEQVVADWSETGYIGGGAIHPLLQFFVEGDMLGFLQAVYVLAFTSADIFYGFITMIGLGAIYIRTKSLALLAILWILVGSTFMVAMPIVAGLGVFFIILGVAGLLFQLVKTRAGSY